MEATDNKMNPSFAHTAQVMSILIKNGNNYSTDIENLVKNFQFIDQTCPDKDSRIDDIYSFCGLLRGAIADWDWEQIADSKFIRHFYDPSVKNNQTSSCLNMISPKTISEKSLRGIIRLASKDPNYAGLNTRFLRDSITKLYPSERDEQTNLGKKKGDYIQFFDKKKNEENNDPKQTKIKINTKTGSLETTKTTKSRHSISDAESDNEDKKPLQRTTTQPPPPPPTTLSTREKTTVRKQSKNLSPEKSSRAHGKDDGSEDDEIDEESDFRSDDEDEEIDRSLVADKKLSSKNRRHEPSDDDDDDEANVDDSSDDDSIHDSASDDDDEPRLIVEKQQQHQRKRHHSPPSSRHQSSSGNRQSGVSSGRRRNSSPQPTTKKSRQAEPKNSRELIALSMSDTYNPLAQASKERSEKRSSRTNSNNSSNNKKHQRSYVRP